MDFFNHVTVLAALAVLTVQQVLKFKFIPATFANKYPVPTNIALSIVASVVAVWKTGVVADSWTDWILLIATVSVVAAIVYNNTFQKWTELRQMESDPQ